MLLVALRDGLLLLALDEVEAERDCPRDTKLGGRVRVADLVLRTDEPDEVRMVEVVDGEVR